MNRCEDIRSRLAIYLDDELEGSERSALEAHLRTCDKCGVIVENERRFLETIRQAKPLHSVPDNLRDRVRAILEQPVPVSSVRPGKEGWRLLELWRSQSRLARALAVTVIVIMILPPAIWLVRPNNESTSSSPSEFALMAADTHLRRTRGQLPLEITSDAAGQISEWFENKVKFQVKLPNYQDLSGQEKLYRLEGARLVGYKDDYAAYVAYEMIRRPISLVITSDTLAQATGGEEIKAKGLTFHYNAINGLKVITWSDRGLTYALVSDLDERGQQSCVVCHQGTKDRDFIEPLKPR